MALQEDASMRAKAEVAIRHERGTHMLRSEVEQQRLEMIALDARRKQDQVERAEERELVVAETERMAEALHKNVLEDVKTKNEANEKRLTDLIRADQDERNNLIHMQGQDRINSMEELKRQTRELTMQPRRS